MTFAITTKSGRSVNIKADNYKEAQKYADRHFGRGCIVQLVGNAAAACEDHPASSNAIVNAALAWKEKAAANAKFKVGDSRRDDWLRRVRRRMGRRRTRQRSLHPPHALQLRHDRFRRRRERGRERGELSGHD